MRYKYIEAKSLKLLVVLGCALAVIIAGSLLLKPSAKGGEEIAAAKTNSQSKGFRLYLTKETSSLYNEGKTDINSLELENEPLFSGSDIISYNWDSHCIKLKDNGKVSEKLLQRGFVVMADQERIYSGAFWSAKFSMAPPRICVFLENLERSGDYIIMSMGSWRPYAKLSSEAEKILSDSRIKRVLERDGQLYKPYEPEHFERPDYVSIYTNGESYGYGGYDWEKTDQLLQLLDSRFVQKLDYVKPELSLKDDAALAALHNETLIMLGYEEERGLIYNIRGEDVKFQCKELIMPVTGAYSDLLYFSSNNGYMASPLGSLEIFKEIDLLKKEPVSDTQTGFDEPDGVHLMYYKGGPFEYKTVCFYELGSDDAEKVKAEAALGKVLKSKPGYNPQPVCLLLRLGKEDVIRAFNDGKTLFSNGKYYDNPVLAGRILSMAREHIGFEVFDISAYKGLVRAKYSFRTHTRTIERITEDKAVLTEMEKELKEAQHNMGGGCPFSDGVLTLTYENGSVLEISMASDDCPLMFIDGCFMEYSKELHNLLENTFDNFPYVRE